MAKYLFVVGGVISGAGKGVCAASIGFLLRQRGFEVEIIKLDPYLNVNAGVLAPREHGECFLCDDGTETDLDLGHYERIAGITVSQDNIATSGILYKELIEEQERGDYLGQTIQVIPHLTNKIISRLEHLAKRSDVVICEIGGTVGDIESGAFLKALTQMKVQHKEDCRVAMVAPILWVPTIKEWKTKPLQRSICDLMSFGIQPEMLFCRADRPIPEKILQKVSNLTYVPRECIFDAPDVKTIYEVPIEFYNRQVDDIVADMFHLKRTGCRIKKFKDLVERYVQNDMPQVNIGIFGKYDNCDEAYISLKEALCHAGLKHDVKVNINWINAEELEQYKDMRGIHKFFDGLHGIIVPGGFDQRGVEGKIKAIRFVREKRLPFLGICLGLQCAVIEFARNECGWENANSTEFDKETTEPVIHFVDGQETITHKSGTMRLGAYDCVLEKDTLSHNLYGKRTISERHRHRYEVNQEFLDDYAKKGMIVSGRNPDSNLVEMMELTDHPFFIGTQAHPEFQSRLTEPAPLFDGLIAAAKWYAESESKLEE